MKSWRDHYLTLLCIALCGYAIIGKGFASLGVAPLLVGELMLALGLYAIVSTGHYAVLLATTPCLFLLALLTWVAVQVTPGVELYGVIALRDAVIVGYGVFALVVERPARLVVIIGAYRWFAGAFGLIAAPLYYLGGRFSASLPLWPVSHVTLVAIRPGEVAVHLTGVIVFTMAGFRRATPLWIALAVLGVGVISPSRGATLACAGPLVAAVILTGRATRLLPYILAGGCLFALAYALDLDVALEGGRSMGPRQIVNDFASLFGATNASNLDGTKAWRLGWWQAIENYTFHGPYFWTGKGFGQSLAEIDGFIVGEELGGPMLRSPHSAHLTLLARTGVPGLALWIGTCASWFAVMASNILTARQRGETDWSGLFVWIGCYVAAILIDASFDVALEGPMLGIWFWCLFGLGIASTMVYRTSVRQAASIAVRRRYGSPAMRPASAMGGRT